MILGNAGFAQADGHDGGVPNGRETGLDAHAVGRLVLQLLQFMRGAHHLRMVIGVAQGFQRNERIQHGRENGG